MFLRDLFAALDRTTARFPDHPAILDGDRLISYRQFQGLIRAAAARFRRHASRRGDRIGLCLDNSANFYGCAYAAALCGLTYVPLSPDEPPARLRTIIGDARLKLLVGSQDNAARMKDALQGMRGSSAPRLVLLDEDALFAAKPEAGPAFDLKSTNDRDPLYMLYTSGSTGTPKGVLIAARCVENFILWARERFEVSRSDVFLAHPRPTFDLSVFNLYAPILAGASVRLARSAADQMYPGEQLKQGVTIALMVPRVTGLMQDAGQLENGDYPTLRHLLFCGERLLAAQVNAWKNTRPNLQIHNLYGPTEATVACTHYRIDGASPAKDPIPIGFALPNMRMELIDGRGEPVSGEGELVIAGAQVSLSDYWKQASGRFFDDKRWGRCFKSGDLVRRDGDGLLYWLSRLDGQVKRRGFRIEPCEIEVALSAHPSIRDLACVYDPGSEELSLVVSLTRSSVRRTAVEGLKKLAAEKLPAYMWPDNYIVWDEIPRNSNGKADRKKIAASIVAGAKT